MKIKKRQKATDIAQRGYSDLVEVFARSVSTIEAVKVVALVRSGNGFRIWTILDKEPENRDLRERVYDIEGATLDKFPGAKVDFRLVNLAEYSNPEALHLPSEEIIYRRE
jgi:hypothetical protein